MRFSKRTNWEASSNRLSKTVERKRKEGCPLIDLTESNPTRCSFNYLKPDFLKPLADPKSLLYEPDPRGLLEAREAVCHYYSAKGIKVEPDQVFLTASTSEAYTFLFRLLLDTGDTALAPRPSYPLFSYLSDLNDVQLEHYSLAYESGWFIDFQSLERHFHRNPKALILVNPNNPTGNFVHEDEREFLNGLCGNREMSIISDEVFNDFNLSGDAKQPASYAGNELALTFTLGGISKILGLPQMKLSWIVVSGPQEICKKAAERLEIIADTYLSVNTPAQWALSAWLPESGPVIEEIRRRLSDNREYLIQTMKGKESVRVLKCEGGWYAVLEISVSLSDEELALNLLEKQNVLTYPGYFFDFPEGNFIVLSLLPKAETFKEGVNRILVVAGQS